MKKSYVNLLTVAFVIFGFLFFFAGCGKQPSKVAKEESLLRLVPAEADGLFAINAKKISDLGLFKEKTAEEKPTGTEPAVANEEEKSEEADTPKNSNDFTEFKEIAENFGIDVEKDVNKIVIAAFTGGKGVTTMTNDPSAIQNVVIVVDANFDKEKFETGLEEKIKEKGVEVQTTDYKGVKIYSAKAKDKEGQPEMGVAVINEKNMAMGNPKKLEQIIDLSMGEGNSILANEKMAPYLSAMRTGALGSFVLVVPQDVKKNYDTGMIKVNLSDAEMITGHIDHQEGTWSGEIKLVSRNAQQNAQLVSILNFFKTVLASALGPELTQLTENIYVGSTEDGVKVSVTINKEMLEQLQKKIKENKLGFPGMQSAPTDHNNMQ